jgi:hypothetical protein
MMMLPAKTLPMSFTFLLSLAALLLASQVHEHVYQLPGAPVEKRVEDLLSRMTPAEKADLLKPENSKS